MQALKQPKEKGYAKKQLEERKIKSKKVIF